MKEKSAIKGKKIFKILNPAVESKNIFQEKSFLSGWKQKVVKILNPAVKNKKYFFSQR